MNEPIARDESRTLIYVHGRECQPAPEMLLELTLAALELGIRRDYPAAQDAWQGVAKRLAYYGQHTNALLTSLGAHYDEQLDVGDCRNALQQLAGYAKRKHFGLSNYDRLPGKSAVPELAAGVAAPLLRSLGLSGKVMGKVVPELQAYWRADGEFAARVQSCVRDALRDALLAGEKVLLVSHGTGAIVTWDVLWQLSHDERWQDTAAAKVDLWLTLGAPLGDNAVRGRLKGAKEQGRARYPANVMSWHNVSAEDDWLCHDNTLADDFRPMLKQKQVSAIRDYHVYNLAVRYGRSDPHCALGYLAHPRVAQIVNDWLAPPLAAGAPTGSA